eukprot:1972029-Amphidinium_carterae.1
MGNLPLFSLCQSGLSPFPRGVPKQQSAPNWKAHAGLHWASVNIHLSNSLGASCSVNGKDAFASPRLHILSSALFKWTADIMHEQCDHHPRQRKAAERQAAANQGSCCRFRWGGRSHTVRVSETAAERAQETAAGRGKGPPFQCHEGTTTPSIPKYLLWLSIRCERLLTEEAVGTC